MRREAHVRFLGGARREVGPYPLNSDHNVSWILGSLRSEPVRLMQKVPRILHRARRESPELKMPPHSLRRTSRTNHGCSISVAPPHLPVAKVPT